MHIVGYCNLQRPVIYSCLEMANNRVVDDNKAHMISTFERVSECIAYESLIMSILPQGGSCHAPRRGAMGLGE